MGTKKAGHSPGTVVHVREKKTGRVKGTLMDYDENTFDERFISDFKDCQNLAKTKTVSWINIDGLHDTKAIEDFGACFDLHPLLLEDLSHTRQRPKIEEYDGYLFIILKMLFFDEKTHAVTVEQVSMVVGPTYVLSFQEQPGDVFDAVR